MSTYNLNIDTLNSSLSFYQAEKYNLSRLLGIYGNSRLGMLKDSVNVLGSAFTNTDSTNVTHTLGNKRYELSNHLGNVLTVITDKPIPHNNGGTVDYWQASIASAYDYSPFGVMLTGRTFEGKQTICEDSTTLITQKPLEEGFNSWGSWTAMGNGLVTYVSGEMQVSNPNTSKKDIGASKTFTTGTGVHNVSFEVIGNTCATVVIWPPSSTPIPIKVSVKDNYGNVVASGNYTTAGTYNLSFTPTTSGANYKIEFYMTNASAFCFFRVDDVLVSYDDTTTVTVCKEVEDGYRYGFNGMEKVDEVSGKGNSYTAEFWQYDSRLGRRWNVDPMFAKAPDWSPYRVLFDNPISYIDPNGLFETRKDAKEFKKENNLKGVIKKSTDNDFFIKEKGNKGLGYYYGASSNINFLKEIKEESAKSKKLEFKIMAGSSGAGLGAFGVETDIIDWQYFSINVGNNDGWKEDGKAIKMNTISSILDVKDGPDVGAGTSVKPGYSVELLAIGGGTLHLEKRYLKKHDCNSIKEMLNNKTIVIISGGVGYKYTHLDIFDDNMEKIATASIHSFSLMLPGASLRKGKTKFK